MTNEPLPLELQQIVVSHLGDQKLYESMWGTVPASMNEIIQNARYNNIVLGSAYMRCCKDIIYLGDLNPKAKNLFVSCFKSESFENALYIYLCMFSRITHEARNEITDILEPEIQKLKNYVLYEMKLTMCKKISDYVRYRYDLWNLI